MVSFHFLMCYQYKSALQTTVITWDKKPPDGIRLREYTTLNLHLFQAQMFSGIHLQLSTWLGALDSLLQTEKRPIRKGLHNRDYEVFFSFCICVISQRT